MQRRFRHRVVYFLFRPVFRLFLKFRFGYEYEPFDESTLKGPYLILGNHTQNLDPVFLAFSFKKPIYFVASTMVFNLPVISPLLKYLVNPIPIDKFRSDVKSAKLILKTLKEGSHVSLFPEGNTSFSGETGPIDEAIAKLVKVAQVPVVFFNLRGGYLTRPRWAIYKRKGPLKGSVRSVLTVEEIKVMSVEALHQKIIEELSVNDFKVMKNARYYGPSKAEGAESGFYYCPHCHVFESLFSKGDHIYCQSCEFDVEADDFGGFEKNFKGTHYETPMTWSRAQAEALKIKIHQSPKDMVLFQDIDWTLYLIRPSKSKLKMDTVDLTMTPSEIHIQGGNTDLKLPVKNVQAAVQMRNNCILHDKITDTTYYLVPLKRGNSLKYVQAISFCQKENRYV
jgi:1-acyl-sn-glycerol-3-phosphate acyltransferase